MCSFHQVDLHIHSPKSVDYRGNRGITAYEFVSAYVERGFDLIAITDHHTGEYIDAAILARDQIASQNAKNIAVLPGVELNVTPGVHLLAILPEGGSAAISDLLSELKLSIEDQGKTEKLILRPVTEVAEAVHNRNGILIGAHANSTNGILEELDGEARFDWLRAVDALEINAGSSDEKVQNTMSYVSDDLQMSVAFVFGSDSHDCESDTVGMWVKLAAPSMNSLKQLIFEPELRVTRKTPASDTHGRIVGFMVTNGIYAGERFRFSPNLNVLLGGRGAGKSAAMDLLRFAFEAAPRTTNDEFEVFTKRIMAFLMSIGEVIVVLAGADGETYVVQRSGKYEIADRHGLAAFSEGARVYQLSGDQLIPHEKKPLEILPVEFYGQEEVAELSGRVDEQLRLIDENIEHFESVTSMIEAEQCLVVGEKRLIYLKESIEELLVEAATREALEGQRDDLADSLANPIFDERARWDQEKRWVQEQQDWVKRVLDSLPSTIPERTDLPIELDSSSVEDILGKMNKTSERVLKIGERALRRFRSGLKHASAELEEYRTEWEKAFESGESRYRDQLDELGTLSLTQAAAEKRGAEGRLARIETIVEPEIARIESEINQLEEERSNLLSQLRRARSAMDRSRSEFVENLNDGLGGNVMVELSGHDTSDYFGIIDAALEGSGMHQRANQIALVCESFMPEEFVSVVRANSIDDLTDIGITNNNASRMIANLDEKVLFELERINLQPLPQIRIKRQGEDRFTDLADLSVGEKCSAILSIALLSKGKPLVIDQPEDALDHAFIIDSIVGGIRKAKKERQIITATHNPNIPVLGDAEMIFRVARIPGEERCRITDSGGLEIPQITRAVQSLEGGAKAFEIRRRRYAGVT